MSVLCNRLQLACEASPPPTWGQAVATTARDVNTIAEFEERWQLCPVAERQAEVDWLKLGREEGASRRARERA